MNLRRLFSSGLAAGAIALTTTLPASAYSRQEEWELNAGQQQYQQLEQQGLIVRDSPYYNVLAPIAKQISAVADKQYFVPFHFYLVKMDQPNAFAVPGGNVYVTTAMMTFAQNKEELAGVLCHEVSHDIHHDVYNLAQKQESTQVLGILAAILTRNSAIENLAAGVGMQAYQTSFSRPVESAADHTGAYLCAQSGINPWGMVWLFNRFESKPSTGGPEFLSDHPRDDHRVTDLENEFKSDPATFGHFSSNPDTGHPLRIEAEREQTTGGNHGYQQSGAAPQGYPGPNGPPPGYPGPNGPPPGGPPVR